MIQRIQSLLLLGVVILLIVNLFVPIWTSGQQDPIKVTAFAIEYNTSTLRPTTNPNSTEQMIIPNRKPVPYIGGLICLCIVVALLIIFRYNDRPLQIKLCYLLTFLILGVVGTYFIAIPQAKELLTVKVDGNFEIGYFLPIISCILVMAARYFINKDEQLVRSVDRLR